MDGPSRIAYNNLFYFCFRIFSLLVFLFGWGPNEGVGFMEAESYLGDRSSTVAVICLSVAQWVWLYGECFEMTKTLDGYGVWRWLPPCSAFIYFHSYRFVTSTRCSFKSLYCILYYVFVFICCILIFVTLYIIFHNLHHILTIQIVL